VAKSSFKICLFFANVWRNLTSQFFFLAKVAMAAAVVANDG
jgi:hypothetical protein